MSNDKSLEPIYKMMLNSGGYALVQSPPSRLDMLNEGDPHYQRSNADMTCLHAIGILVNPVRHDGSSFYLPARAHVSLSPHEVDAFVDRIGKGTVRIVLLSESQFHNLDDVIATRAHQEHFKA